MSDKDETKPEDQDDDAGADRADDDPEGQDQLGDAGKKAIDAMKTKWQAERDARKERDAELATAKAELAKLKGGESKKDEQPDADEIRKQARAEADTAVLKDRALDKVEAKAAKLFEDPEDARALLASKVDDFIDDGKVDEDAIKEALADLLKKKPHLAATAGTRFNGSADGGARKGSGKPAQYTEQDLKRMSPQQIVDARAKGQLDDLMNS